MHSRRAAFSLLAAAMLVVSLGIKARVMEAVPVMDLPAFNRGLAALLASQGFAVGIEDRAGDGDLIAARRGTCMLKTRSEETADMRRSFELFSAGLPVLRYRYRGTLRDNFPGREYVLRGLADRMLLRLGLIDTTERPLVIAATRECDLTRIDFGPQLVRRQQR